ncbi:hypothetical protein FZC11_09265, partial [Enterococcus faecium]|nr:hypothetical protein [Enterococcus faecium]
NLSQNVVHSDSDLILHNSSVLIDKEPFLFLLQKDLDQISFRIFAPNPIFLLFRCCIQCLASFS